jgi:hypothetical protein
VSAKAKKKATTARSLPLVSSNWWPGAQAILYVRERVGDRTIADTDLAAAINRLDVPIKIEALDRRTDPPRKISEVLQKTFFHNYPFKAFVNGICPLPHTPDGLRPHDKDLYTIRPHAFFAWGPEVQRLWPASTTESNTAGSNTTGSRSVLRQQTGPKTARRWQDHVLREIVRAHWEGRPDPSASELAQSCTVHVGVTPETSAITRFLRDVRDGR